MAEDYAAGDPICRIGVQVAPILELVIRQHPMISLEGAPPNSLVRTYLRYKEKKTIKKEDLQFWLNS